MRNALAILDDQAIPYYVTGSEAAACYGVLRQTFDLDVVIDLEPDRFNEIRTAFESDFAIAEPIAYADFSMASVISRRTADKVDVIMRRASPWSTESMRRRHQLPHPRHGSLWVVSLEDLILAKLVWSEGTSELQLRDCSALLRLNQAAVDNDYLDRWAGVLRVTDLLRGIRDAT